MDTLVIDRKRWGRGKKDGGSLLNKDNMMCCLGFECIRLGLHDGDIKTLGMPDEVDGSLQAKLIGTGLTYAVEDESEEGCYNSSVITSQLAVVNDNPDISDDEREIRIKELFLQLRVPREVVFID